MQAKYTYGPVPSRRLGFSLGIDIVPYKNCSFDCIYCQLGRTTNKTTKRMEFTPAQGILKEIRRVIKNTDQIDYLTFSGSGEPTLHSRLGYLIKELKKITKIPIAVLTNGSLLHMADVQEDLSGADVVLPTLCTATKGVFRKIHRSHTGLSIDQIIEGMVKFRRIYEGKIWLEVMLIKGINDTAGEIKKLKDIIKKVKPDKIHLNTVVRPPSEKYATPLSISELQKIKKMFGKHCEIIVDFKKNIKRTYSEDIVKKIFNLTKRRPVTLDDISRVTGLHKNEIPKYMEHLKRIKKIKITMHDRKYYYEAI